MRCRVLGSILGSLLGVLLVSLLTATSSCRRKERREPTRTPEQALAQTTAAARGGELGVLFELLDKKSRWSLMSVHKSQRQICGLVRAHYPKERQTAALQRCHSAERATDVKAFFIAHAKEHREQVLEPLLQFAPPGKPVGAGERVELVSGGRRLPFCRADGVWLYCGLRTRFDSMKLKAVRDLTTVRENVESYR